MLSVIWYSILLGIDGFAVSLGLGPLTECRTRYVVASAFGFCDGLAILLSPLLNASFPSTVSAWAGRMLPILLVAYAIYVLLLARSAKTLTRAWAPWLVLPIATSIDNLAMGGHMSSTVPIGTIAVIAALTSATMSLAGLMSIKMLLTGSKMVPGRVEQLLPRWLAVTGLLAAAAYLTR